nr:helix-turn-helix domain-containing protein [Deinococcus sp. RM]
MGTMEGVPSGAVDAAGETHLRVGRWHERTQIYRAARVQEARQQLGLNQAEWAQVLGVSVKTVQAWEQGVNNVPEEIEEYARLVRERAVTDPTRPAAPRT